MIRNWQEHELYMDFSGLAIEGHGQPSDIDLFYMGRDWTLIIGEIKHERGYLKEGQRRLLEKIIKGYRYEAICLYIVHDQDVHTGATTVDVSKCQVKEYFWHGHWRVPAKYTTVKDVIDYFSKPNVF